MSALGLMGEVDCDMRHRDNRRVIPSGAFVTRTDGEQVQVMHWEPGFGAWLAWHHPTGRKVLLFPSELPEAP